MKQYWDCVKFESGADFEEGVLVWHFVKEQF